MDVTARQRSDSSALNAVYGLASSANLRAGYSYTLARPQFRELAPFAYFDFVRRRTVWATRSCSTPGYTTQIHGLSRSPGDDEVLAASVFGKQFINPIEQVVVSAAQGEISFANAPGATSVGVELEARSSLGRLMPGLAAFRVGGNLSLIRSEALLGQRRLLRPLSAVRCRGSRPTWPTSAWAGLRARAPS